MDFKPFLIDYMVENGLKFVQDVDWKALTKLPKFRGLIITFIMFPQLSIDGYHTLCVNFDQQKFEIIPLPNGLIFFVYSDHARGMRT